MLDFAIKETGNTDDIQLKIVVMVGINNRLSLLECSGISEEYGGIVDDIKEIIEDECEWTDCEYGIWECKYLVHAWDTEYCTEYESELVPVKLIASVDKVNELLAEYLLLKADEVQIEEVQAGYRFVNNLPWTTLYLQLTKPIERFKLSQE
jgi:hypothetical protein